MFGRKQPRWMKTDDHLIKLDEVFHFQRRGDSVSVSFKNPDLPSLLLTGTSLEDVHYFLKHGKPRKR